MIHVPAKSFDGARVSVGERVGFDIALLKDLIKVDTGVLCPVPRHREPLWLNNMIDVTDQECGRFIVRFFYRYLPLRTRNGEEFWVLPIMRADITPQRFEF